MQASSCLSYAFHATTHFLHHIFPKMLCSCLGGEHNFAKRFHALLIEKSTFSPPNGIDKSIVCHFIYSFRSFGRSDRDFFAPCPHQNIASGCSPVHFSPPDPRQQKWMYASMQQFCQFRIRSAVFFVPSMLRTLFLQNIILFSENMLPALGGKHDFESGTKAKSWKMCLLGLPIMPVCTLFAPFIATWNLQNPFEKCVF